LLIAAVVFYPYEDWTYTVDLVDTSFDRLIANVDVWVRGMEAMLEMIIDSIRVSLMNYQRVVILKEKESERYLPIWIGSPEADAIAVKLQDLAVPRPLTHDLLGSVIGTLGASVEHILVSGLTNDTFYAKMFLSTQKEGTERPNTLEIDCRPSDAIAMAVRTGVPIYVDEGVLDRAGIVMDQADGDNLGTLEGRRASTRIRPVTEEEIKGMSAFSEFLNELPGLEELGKPLEDE
jgi:bifunctional DNase/RNase